MQVMEHLSQWSQTFESGWLAHLRATGETDWKQYERPSNEQVPSGAAVDPATAQILLITSSGAYLRDEQPPFDAENDLGDYSLRTFPAEMPFDRIAFAHTHYDHAAVNRDAQVLLPLRHLQQMADEGTIGGVVPTVISYSGYQPDARRTLDTTIPAILEAVQWEAVDAALLVPA